MQARSLLISAVALAPLLACTARVDHDHGHEHADPFAGVGPLVCVLAPTAGNTAAGEATFTATEGGLRVDVRMTGLTPNARHAIHVHEFGDLRSTDGTSLGGHFNPEGHDHGLPEQSERHAGDLGNLTADAQGAATYSITVDNATLAGPSNPVLGRGLVVHAGPDDGGQPVGNAGARIAVGVIGVAKP